MLQEHGSGFDIGFTSVLKRAIKTLDISLDNLDQVWIPVEKLWRLDERFYGASQALNKAETSEKYGTEQVQQGRRDPHAHRLSPATPPAFLATLRATST